MIVLAFCAIVLAFATLTSAVAIFRWRQFAMFGEGHDYFGALYLTACAAALFVLAIFAIGEVAR